MGPSLSLVQTFRWLHAPLSSMHQDSLHVDIPRVTLLMLRPRDTPHMASRLQALSSNDRSVSDTGYSSVLGTCSGHGTSAADPDCMCDPCPIMACLRYCGKYCEGLELGQKPRLTVVPFGYCSNDTRFCGTILCGSLKIPRKVSTRAEGSRNAMANQETGALVQCPPGFDRSAKLQQAACYACSWFV